MADRENQLNCSFYIAYRRRGGVRASIFVKYFLTIKVNINMYVGDKNLSIFSLSSAAVKIQFSQRHLSSLYTILELYGFRVFRTEVIFIFLP